MRFVKFVIISIVTVTLIGGCSLGPFHITHEEGNKPKFHMTGLTENCKTRFRKVFSSSKYIIYECKWEID